MRQPGEIVQQLGLDQRIRLGLALKGSHRPSVSNLGRLKSPACL